MELACINTETLSIEDRKNIDSTIDQLISRHKNNRYQINRLVFESVAALTSSENYSKELANQGRIKRFWNSITGKNRSLQEGINRGLVQAQYASQQTLQKLAEQNLMSFELITAVNNKLNASMLEVETEINKIYGALVTFFKQSRSDIIQLESRVARLEKNVNILNWQNSIEYQMYNGIEYSQLNDTTKIVCLVRDFYSLTEGEWTTSDLLLLKTAMATIGLDPRGSIDYEHFIKDLYVDVGLYNHLVSEELKCVNIEPEYATLMAGINKLHSLNTDEQYLITSTVKLLEKHGVTERPNNVAYDMMNEYITATENVNFATEVSSYEFVLELLYNLGQVKASKFIKNKLNYAERLFLDYRMKEALPILEELSDYGYIRAKYMLALIYEEGYQGIEKNLKRAQSLLKDNLDAGDSISAVYFLLFNNVNFSPLEDEKEIIAKAKGQLISLAQEGDVFAQYELGRYYLNDHEFEKRNPIEAIRYLDLAAEQGFWRANHSLGVRYENGDGVEQIWEEAVRYYKIAADKGFVLAQNALGSCYWNGNGIEKNLETAVEWYKKAAEQCHPGSNVKLSDYYACENIDYEKALRYATTAAELGHDGGYNNLGALFFEGNGVVQNYTKAAEYIQVAANMGNKTSQYNLGIMFLHGLGVGFNRQKAKEWFERSAAQGFQDAISALKENF